MKKVVVFEKLDPHRQKLMIEAFTSNDVSTPHGPLVKGQKHILPRWRSIAALAYGLYFLVDGWGTIQAFYPLTSYFLLVLGLLLFSYLLWRHATRLDAPFQTGIYLFPFHLVVAERETLQVYRLNDLRSLDTKRQHEWIKVTCRFKDGDTISFFAKSTNENEEGLDKVEQFRVIEPHKDTLSDPSILEQQSIFLTDAVPTLAPLTRIEWLKTYRMYASIGLAVLFSAVVFQASSEEHPEKRIAKPTAASPKSQNVAHESASPTPQPQVEATLPPQPSSNQKVLDESAVPALQPPVDAPPPPQPSSPSYGQPPSEPENQNARLEETGQRELQSPTATFEGKRDSFCRYPDKPNSIYSMAVQKLDAIERQLEVEGTAIEKGKAEIEEDGKKFDEAQEQLNELEATFIKAKKRLEQHEGRYGNSLEPKQYNRRKRLIRVAKTALNKLNSNVTIAEEIEKSYNGLVDKQNQNIKAYNQLLTQYREQFTSFSELPGVSCSPSPSFP